MTRNRCIGAKSGLHFCSDVETGLADLPQCVSQPPAQPADAGEHGGFVGVVVAAVGAVSGVFLWGGCVAVAGVAIDLPASGFADAIVAGQSSTADSAGARGGKGFRMELV